jgi:hypothetical protein
MPWLLDDNSEELLNAAELLVPPLELEFPVLGLEATELELAILPAVSLELEGSVFEATELELTTLSAVSLELETPKNSSMSSDEQENVNAVAMKIAVSRTSLTLFIKNPFVGCCKLNFL